MFILYFALFSNGLLHILHCFAMVYCIFCIVLQWFIESFAFICNSLLHILHCHAIVFTNLPAHSSDRAPLRFRQHQGSATTEIDFFWIDFPELDFLMIFSHQQSHKHWRHCCMQNGLPAMIATIAASKTYLNMLVNVFFYYSFTRCHMYMNSNTWYYHTHIYIYTHMSVEVDCIYIYI